MSWRTSFIAVRNAISHPQRRTGTSGHRHSGLTIASRFTEAYRNFSLSGAKTPPGASAMVVGRWRSTN